MPFGFSRKLKEKVGRDPNKNHEKKERESSRGRANAYEQERKEKHAMDKKINESKIKIQQMSSDLRAKTEQITELLTTVSERTSENDDLRANIKDLDDKIAELETRISNDDHLIRIEPKYFDELKESVANCQKYEKLLNATNAKLARLDTDSAAALSAEKATCAKLRTELDTTVSATKIDQAKLQKDINQIEGQLKSVKHENALLSANQENIEQQLRATDDERNVLENELKNSMKDNLSLESDLQKLKDELDRREKMDEMQGVLEKLSIVENQLRDSMVKNQSKDKMIMQKDEELETRQNRMFQMQNDMSEKDNQIEKQQHMINDLRYKIKDDGERFESQFEETMMMHTRQLQSMRQSVDPTQVRNLESDVKRFRDQVKSEQELNRQKTIQLTDLKTKCSRLEIRSRTADDIEKYKRTVDELRGELKQEKSSRNEEKLNYETIIHNLRGHMLNIYTGNISADMAQLLNASVQLELRKQNKKIRHD